MKRREADIWREQDKDRRFYAKRLGIAGVVICLLSYVFYHSIWFAIPLSLGLIPYIRITKRSLQRKKREQFRLQLRDFLQLLSGNLQAGDSMENGMEHTLPELAEQWGENSFIYRDVESMVRQIKLSHQTVRILTRWGELRQDKELQVFLQVFLYGKQAGSDLCQVIKKTTDSISRRIETKQEIDTMMASQRYEQAIMSAMPMLLLFYVGLTNQDYLMVLYQSTGGMIFMTVCLLLYGGCVLLGLRILRIEVEE